MTSISNSLSFLSKPKDIMGGLYTIVMLVQAFCFYHAYKNRKEYYWYILIFFLPIIGTIIYLFVHFYSPKTIIETGEKIKNTVNKGYEMDTLLKEAKYTDTVANRIKLADAYASRGEYQQAIALYDSCLQGFNKDDTLTQEKLLVAKYFVQDYQGAIDVGNRLFKSNAYNHSESKIAYAWSHYYLGMNDEAEKLFQEMDIPFTNYTHRLDFAEFLQSSHQQQKAKDLLLKMKDEIDHMDPYEKRLKKAEHNKIKGMLKNL